MSTPPSKTTVTTERPDFESDRTWASRGRPRMAISTGKVTNRSTSGGDMPGAADRTSTWTLVTSGKASMEMLRTDQTPRAMRKRTPTTTKALFRSERSIMPSIMPMFVSQPALAHLGFQEEASRSDDGLPFLEAAEDFDVPGEPFAGLDLAPGERPLPGLDEDPGQAFVIL